jgi:hypothetical protein
MPEAMKGKTLEDVAKEDEIMAECAKKAKEALAK